MPPSAPPRHYRPTKLPSLLDRRDRFQTRSERRRAGRASFVPMERLVVRETAHVPTRLQGREITHGKAHTGPAPSHYMALGIHNEELKGIGTQVQEGSSGEVPTAQRRGHRGDRQHWGHRRGGLRATWRGHRGGEEHWLGWKAECVRHERRGSGDTSGTSDRAARSSNSTMACPRGRPGRPPSPRLRDYATRNSAPEPLAGPRLVHGAVLGWCRRGIGREGRSARSGDRPKLAP